MGNGIAMEKFNVLDFEMFDPIEAGEAWAVEFGTNHKVVEIYIDGKKLIDIIRVIETPYTEVPGAYGHVSPYDLYDDLCTATDGHSYSCLYGVYLFCCRGCGEPGCWSVTCKVKEDEKFVYWYSFEHEHRDWSYNLNYRFDKTAYAQAMEKLKEMALNQSLT